MRYGVGYRLGVLPQLLGGDYFAMTVGVMLFHLQHVFDPGYVRRPGASSGQKWSLKEARDEWDRIRSWSKQNGRDPRELKRQERQVLIQQSSGPTLFKKRET